MPTVNGFNTVQGVLKYNFEALENYNTPDFSQAQTYVYNDYVMYNGKLYKYINLSPSAGAWDSSKWQLVILTNEIKNLFQNDKNLEDDINDINNDITDIENQMIGKEIIANEFSNGINYSVGDYVFYNNQLYKFILPHNAGAWNQSDVIIINLSGEIKSNTNEITNLSEKNNDLENFISIFDDIPGTTQTVNFDAADQPSSIIHTKSGEVVRTDTFVWEGNNVTQKKTLANGKSITYITNLSTLVTTISEIEESN